jgi:hypothetical protein
MTDPSTLLILATLASAFLCLSLYMPRTWRLSVTLWTSVPQFFTISVAGIYPPATLLIGLATWPELLRWRRLAKWPPVFFFLCLLLMHVVSLAWSPNVVLGIRNIIYLLPFLLMVATGYGLAQQAPRTVCWGLLVFTAVALFEAGLVCLFRLLPSVEDAFLHSGLARLFITPNLLEVLFDEARNNVLDPAKAGGFLTNANVASCFLGISAFVAWGMSSAYGMRLAFWSAMALLLAVFFTGSKAGAAVGVILFGVNYLLRKMLLSRLTYTRLLLVGVTILLATVGAAAMLSALSQSEFAQDSQQTFDTRNMIWLHAALQFAAHPILGQGFGGWEQSFVVYAANRGLSEGFPPHNTLVCLWSQSGILAAIIGVVFMLSVLRFGYQAMCVRNAEVRALAIGTTTAFLWTFIQGMGENWGIVGDLHMQPLLAVALGLTYARYQDVRQTHMDQG